jgi:hypothetical protein
MGVKAGVCTQNIECVIVLKRVISAASALIDKGTFTCIPSIGSEYLSNVSGAEAAFIARPGSPDTKRSEAQGLERGNQMLTFRERVGSWCRGRIGSGLP